MKTLAFNIGLCGDDLATEFLWDKMQAELKSIKCENSSWKYNVNFSYASLSTDDGIIGIVFFAPLYNEKIAYIAGAYVLPKWRKLGVYSKLWSLFVDYCGSQQDLDIIQSGYHKNNIRSNLMQSSQKREIFGETATHIRTRLYLRRGTLKFNEITPERLGIIYKELSTSPNFLSKVNKEITYFFKRFLVKVKKF